MDSKIHQNQLSPKDNKFHVGNGSDGKHYWLTPPELYAQLDAEFNFDFDPCPFPKPESFDGLTCDWGQSNYVNPPFGSIIHQGKKKGPTAWVRKCIEEWQKGKRVVLVYPIDKWVLMLLKAIVGENGHVRNLGDVRWLATEDGSRGKGTGRHIACFILEPCAPPPTGAQAVPATSAVPVDVLRDAERYRWLRSLPADAHERNGLDVVLWVDDLGGCPRGEYLDEEIDAAMLATHPQPAVAEKEEN